MAYQDNSPEAIMGKICEQVVDEYVRNIGWWRLEVSNLGAGAMLHGPAGALIALDRLYVLGHGVTHWCDIKSKHGPVVYQKRDVCRHGIDERVWQHYLAVQKLTNIPAALAVVELKRARSDDCVFAPQLLWQSLKRLEECVRPSDSDNKMVYWDRDDFDVLGPIHIDAEKIPLTVKNLHPWEFPSQAGYLRVPPGSPRQGDLFYDQRRRKS